MDNETEFPMYVITAATSGALIGTILDSMEVQAARHIGENRSYYEQNPDQKPIFDRAAIRAALIKRFPNLDPAHRDSAANVQQRANAQFRIANNVYDTFR